MSPTPPPTPIPAPTPSAVQSPTQTVIVNLPPDVIDKLSPHETGLPQSWATIIAACIAVAAAAIALLGVWWQIRSAAREARNDRAADVRLTRQTQLAEHMAEAIQLGRSLQDLISSNRGNLRDWAEAPRNAFNEQTQRARALSSIIFLLGAKKSGAKLHELVYKCNVLAKDRKETWGKHTFVLAGEMSKIFEEELSAYADVPLPTQSEP
ncbi:hypothetical protein [Mycobacterium paraffinicum]|uniref:Uncharacterized protein n=1 Tax=Mycobacterium paraffinicum TaxID=53378 RepID=A0ABP8F8G7_9MYCO|nr:hypothetical protein [Mycobacterium paraffinicum]MCV7309865.1 hypothetical protein [Mycobacterium paraffinicum]